MSSGASASKPAVVSVLKAQYDDIDIGSLLHPLGGLSQYIAQGDSVLLKMNLLSARGPAEAVTTDPVVVEAVAREVKLAGGVPYIADSPAGSLTKKALRKAYDRTGITETAKKESVELSDDTGSFKMRFPEGRRLKSSAICRYIRKADKIIALPKIKTHAFQYMTLACKIMYGVVPGLTKGAYHARYPGRPAFADMLLDLLTEIRPDLYIMDGIVGMEGEGPANGDPVKLGFVMASTDPVAMDLAACRILGIEPIGIPVLKRANVRGMWPERIEFPLLQPEDVAVEGFRLPSTAEHIVTGEPQARKHPVGTKKCIACGDCAEICPKNAITVDADAAEVNHEACIRCFCCHEVCPEDAIVLSSKRP